MTNIIAQKFIPSKPSSSNLFGNNELKQFIAKPETQTWNRAVSPPVAISDVKRLGQADLVRLAKIPFELELLFSRLKTKDGQEIDLRIKVLCIIDAPLQFLQVWNARLDATGRLITDDIEDRIKNNTLPNVIEQIAVESYTELTTENSIPHNTWKNDATLICPAFTDLGLELSEITQVNYLCEKEAEREALNKFRSEYELRENREQVIAEYEEATKKRQLETAERIREIEHNQQLSFELRQAARFQASGDQTLAQLQFDRDRLKIEDEMAVIRDQKEDRERIKRERRNLEEQFELFRRDHQQDQNAIAEALRGIEEILKNGTPTSESLFHTLAGCSTATLRKFGIGNTPEMYRVYFHELSDHSDKVSIKVIDALSRDIGCKKFNELRVEQSLAFEFISPKSGYATVINLGTSGNFWLHVPNAYISVKQSQVQANRKYSVPGELLPQAELRRYGLDYIETGPVGWEELIIIVTPTPLMSEADTFETSPQSPFSRISMSRMESLLTTLSEIPASDIALGAIGFVVRD